MVESEAKQKEMTIINDIADLVRILREDPAWADAVRSVLLSQELLNLPQEVVALTKAFREHAETTNRRLASLEAGQDELKQGQAQLQTTVDGLQNGVEGLETKVDGLQNSVEGLETKVDGLQNSVEGLETKVNGLYNSVEGLETKVNGLYNSVEGLETKVNGLETTVNGMRGELGNVSGAFFQRRAASFAVRVARRDFHLRETSLIHHADQVGDNTLKQMLYEAADDPSRDFTEDEGARVEQADAVIAGKAPDGTRAYLLAEASITVLKADVERAMDRAQLLGRAAATKTHALVIGETIAGDAETLAKDLGVEFAALTPERPRTQDFQTSQEA